MTAILGNDTLTAYRPGGGGVADQFPNVIEKYPFPPAVERVFGRPEVMVSWQGVNFMTNKH